MCPSGWHKSTIIDETKDPREAMPQVASSAPASCPNPRAAQLLRASILGVIPGEWILKSTI